MEDVGEEEIATSCCACLTAIFSRFRSSRKRRVNQPSENYRVTRVLNRLRRRLKERQAQTQAAPESNLSGSQKVTETNQATDTKDGNQVMDAATPIWSKWFITQQRRKLERQAKAAKTAASESRLHKSQPDQATETIETPEGATKTIEVPEVIEDNEGQEVMASDLPKMAEEAAPQEPMGCWGDVPSTPLEDAEATEKAEGEQGLIAEDDLDSVSSTLKDLVMEKQYSMYGDPDTVSIVFTSSESDLSELDRLQSQDDLDTLSITSTSSNLSGLDSLFQSQDDLDLLSVDSSSSNLSGLDSLFQSQDDLDTLSNGSSISNLGLEDLFNMEEEVNLNMMNQDGQSVKQEGSTITPCRALGMLLLCAGAVGLGFMQAYMLGF
ncbi:uncharacterized protein LOC134463507 [Engraulis encrasicolus]|uniref:uncharacterized protein LOC134463507 n=1 Tax=Engraulis encrasicolus TaxID=184585 RepID=UPI002FD3684B